MTYFQYLNFGKYTKIQETKLHKSVFYKSARNQDTQVTELKYNAKFHIGNFSCHSSTNSSMFSASSFTIRG